MSIDYHATLNKVITVIDCWESKWNHNEKQCAGGPTLGLPWRDGGAWLNASVLKTENRDERFGGSNPSPAANILNKNVKRKIKIMTQKEINMKKMLIAERLDKLMKKGGNAPIIAKLKRRIRALESATAAE